jgi:hypothetical protein
MKSIAVLEKILSMVISAAIVPLILNQESDNLLEIARADHEIYCSQLLTQVPPMGS